MTARSGSDLAADVRATIEFLDSCIRSAEPLTETVMAMESDALAAVDEFVERLEAAEADSRRWLAWSGGDYPDDSPGDVISADADGTIVLDDGITTWNPLRALEHMEAQVAALTAELEALRRGAA